MSEATGAGLIFTERLGEEPDLRLLTVVRTPGNPPPGTAIAFPSRDLSFQRTPTPAGPQPCAPV